MSANNATNEELNSGWVSAAKSEQKIVHPGGVFEFGVGQSDATMAVGLANASSSELFTDIDHALLLRDDGLVQVYEKGVAVSAPRPYAPNDVFSLRVIVAAGLSIVSYVHNGEEFHATRDTAPHFPLVGRVMFRQQQAKLLKASFSPFSASELDKINPEEVVGGLIELSQVERARNPQEVVGYNVYQSTNPDLPKNRWKKLTDKPIPDTQFVQDKSELQSGITYYTYITAVNGYGIESAPSEVITFTVPEEE